MGREQERGEVREGWRGKLRRGREKWKRWERDGEKTRLSCKAIYIRYLHRMRLLLSVGCIL